MMGDHRNPGLLIRCIDVVFESLKAFKAEKFKFKPDKMNGFDIQSEDDRQRELYQVYKTPKTPKR